MHARRLQGFRIGGQAETAVPMVTASITFGCRASASAAKRRRPRSEASGAAHGARPCSLLRGARHVT
eukprot:scaffold125802_cov42-Phaeocystis_antarctica.AAC.1